MGIIPFKLCFCALDNIMQHKLYSGLYAFLEIDNFDKHYPSSK